jgi:hypothetical protein
LSSFTAKKLDISMIIFKGGTSLSKAWNLIQRVSDSAGWSPSQRRDFFNRRMATLDYVLDAKHSLQGNKSTTKYNFATRISAEFILT